MIWRRWFSFTGTLLGGFYFFMLLSVAIHELLGHGLAAVLCGGRFESFSVLPGLGGWARIADVAQGRSWIVTAAGSTVQLLLGLSGLLVLEVRRRHLSAAVLAIWLFVVSNVGSALGYTAHGLIFLKGDAGELARDLTVSWRILASVLAAALAVCFLAWVLRRLTFYLEEHFAPEGRGRRMRAFLLCVALPLGAFLLAKPSVEVFGFWERTVALAAEFLLLVAGGLLFARKAPRGVDLTAARPPGPWHAAAWLGVALAAGLATAFWLEGPVPVDLGPLAD